MKSTFAFCALIVAACGSPVSGPPEPGQAPTSPPTREPSASQAASAWSDPVPLAIAAFDLLPKRDFAGFLARCGPEMKAALSEAALDGLWNTVSHQAGAFEAREEVNAASNAGGFLRATVRARFEKGSITFRLTFRPTGEIAGFFMNPLEAPYSLPEYAREGSYREESVSVGAAPFALPGTLTLPNGSGPFPAVVLLHGSGPNDRDESLGPQKVFRDLAFGLASRGIAVLRYDKRTLVFPDQFTDEDTLQEETIDDAWSALALLRARPEINATKLVIAGHSLGGMAAPRVAQKATDLAGIVVLAGPTRPLEDLIDEQMNYLAKLDGKVDLSENLNLSVLKTQVANVKDPALSKETPKSTLPLQLSAAYWLDLRDYRPAEVAKTLPQPMLILQGERDYQVTQQDLDGWKAALGKREDVTLTSYPKLNHLFIAGEGAPSPEEYKTPGHVSAEVVRDISDWILAR
jgi:uncharacterized protein